MEQFSTNPQASAARQEKVVLRRIRAIDIEIRSGTYPNTNDLAKKLEVGVRTISRDIEEMKLFYNAPIAFDRAKNGYYYTEDSFYIKDISLSEGELFSVALFERLLSGYRNTPLEKHLRSVFRKIAASLGERATIDTMYLDDSVTYISEPLAQIDAEVFNTVFSAVRTSKEIRFDYRPLQKQTYMSRTVRPYHIVCQKGSWYVIGFDSYKSDIRIFAFSRIKNATTTGETFEIPEDFDWRKYIDADIGVWASSQVSHIGSAPARGGKTHEVSFERVSEKSMIFPLAFCNKKSRTNIGYFKEVGFFAEWNSLSQGKARFVKNEIPCYKEGHAETKTDFRILRKPVFSLEKQSLFCGKR